MEVSRGLLVAIMFVMLLSLGIVNILNSLAAIINRRSDVKVSGIHLNWLILLLLAHFNLFWHTVDILSVEDWGFMGFLYTISGPILIFFATSILVPEGSVDDAREIEGYYHRVSRQFFQIFALVQLWVLGADLVLQGGLVRESVFNVLNLIVAVVLSISRSHGMHKWGTALVWLFLLATLTLRGIGVIN
jgi:hypothetical protein